MEKDEKEEEEESVIKIKQLSSLKNCENYLKEAAFEFSKKENFTLNKFCLFSNKLIELPVKGENCKHLDSYDFKEILQCLKK